MEKVNLNKRPREAGQVSVEYILICGVLIGSLALGTIVTNKNLLVYAADSIKARMLVQTLLLRLPW